MWSDQFLTCVLLTNAHSYSIEPSQKWGIATREGCIFNTSVSFNEFIKCGMTLDCRWKMLVLLLNYILIWETSLHINLTSSFYCLLLFTVYIVFYKFYFPQCLVCVNYVSALQHCSKAPHPVQQFSWTVGLN